jgi:hypothetical protein
MNEPLLQSSAQDQRSLWETAPGWRRLTITASVLTLAAVAVPLLLPQPQTATPSQPIAAVVAQARTAPAIVSAAPAAVVASVQPKTMTRPPAHPAPVLPQPATPQPAAPPPEITATPITPQVSTQPAQTAPQASSNATACAMGPAPTAPQLMGFGTIIRFEDHATSLARIPFTEASVHGKIDPDYIDNLRVLVRKSDGTGQYFIVPKNMVVQIGDRVTLQSSYRNMALPCNYIPITLGSDIGPDPAAANASANAVAPRN